MSQTYSSLHYDTIRRVEDSHFWFCARSEMLSQLVFNWLPPSKTVRFLEVGCGTGVVIRLLSDLGYRVSGLDVNAKAIALAKEKVSAPLFRQTLYTFHPSKRYDAVGAFDVLEHQENDVLFLRRCRKLLRTDGYLFLTVPAGKWLWSSVDVASGHKRRYDREDLLRKLANAGFQVQCCCYWNTLLLPLYFFFHNIVTRQRKRMGVELFIRLPHPYFNTMFSLIMRFENVLFRRIRFPIGTTLVVVARAI